MENKAVRNIFQNKAAAMFLAATCSLVWACAFPLVKMGMGAFKIDVGDVGAKTLFAGIRFFAAGIVVLIIAKLMKRSFAVRGAADKVLLLLFGLVNTALQYFCFYIGLSVQSGSRSAIIDSLSSFFLIILACICFKSEKMTLRKIAGCVLGFAGVLIVNIGGDVSGAFTFMGDGMLLLSAVCFSLGGILTRIVTRKTDPIVATGASLTFGGGLLMVAGLFSGSNLDAVTVKGIVYLVLLIAISVYGFTVYNQLLCYNPVGEIAIFNALIPILGVVLSCVLLGEPFAVKYIIAGAVVAIGVYVINHNGNEGQVRQNEAGSTAV